MDDRIEQATRILVETLGRGRAFTAGKLRLVALGYTTEEIAEAIRLWRAWKRGMREVGSQ